MRKNLRLIFLIAILCPILVFAQRNKKPNILVIWADDFGYWNSSCYNQGMMGYQTPNIDRIANEGALFTDAYAQQSCTAGRAAFTLGQHPFRTGLLTIGMPGSKHGIPEWAPTIGDVMKEQGYTTAQFGKNHLGDQDEHLPTNHGFDYFYGNLYHLNAEEEPESYYYPKDPEFRKNYGPRGVIKASADGKVEDTGPLTKKRMETIDADIKESAKEFIGNAVDDDKPFFVWWNSTRMHVWTHLREEYYGKSGISIYADGTLELDDMIGDMMAYLESKGVLDNTIIVFSTDNGVEKFTWPDGGNAPFTGEKGSTYEGGFRVPLVMRWPGVIDPGTKYNCIISQEDMLPTLAAAAGDSKVKEKLMKGANYNGKNWKVHLDGYNFMPYFKGEVDKSPREEIFYFSASGELNAVRWNDFKISFARILGGTMPKGYRHTQAWPIVNNLRADPFEVGDQSELYLKWYGDNMWLFVPVGGYVMNFLKSLPGYPMQSGSSLNVSGINYNTLKMQSILKQLEAMGVKPQY